MLKRQKSGITLLGYPLYLVLLVLFIITYLMLKSLKKKTIQAKIIDTLVNNGINPITASFVFCQAAHETGNFTSPLFFSNNNCFGMKPPREYVIAVGEKFGYADYNSIEDSAIAMSMWLQSHGLSGGLQTIDQYVNSLHDKSYFEASLQEYMSGVKHFYSMYYEQ
jgi:uncharacterized FlgJ-related protein